MKKIFPFLATLLICIPASANTLIVEEIIAKVNGDIITRSEYEDVWEDIQNEVRRNPNLTDEQKQEDLDQREKNVLRDLIDQRLLIQKAEDVGVNVESQVLRQRDEIMKQYKIETVDEFEQWINERAGMPVEDFLDQMRDNFKAQAVLGQEVGSRIVVPREEIEAYYEEHKEEFQRSEGVRLSEILISTEGKTPQEIPEVRKKAEEIHERVKKGEPFAEMARRHSENPATAPNGGDIGIFRRGDLRKEIEDLVFDANSGYITDLIELPNGFLILKVEERYREGIASLEEVQEEIRARLAAPRYQPAIREYLTSLRERAYIEIRPGYVDTAAAPGQDTSWSDPAKLAPVTTTREEVLSKKKKRRLLWIIPLPGGGGGDDKPPEEAEAEAETN